MADHPTDLLLHQQRPSALEPRQRRRLTRRGWWLVGIASSTVFALVVALLVVDQAHQRDAFAGSKAALAVTNRDITTVSPQLAALQHDLGTLTTQVGSDTTAFDQVASQLKGAQTALKAALAHVSVQSTQITSLQTCLGGVEQALNAFAVDSQQRAVSELESVSSSCTAAAEASG
jgi:septal ring factor EnvC (AmiA/AmiB activator)